MEALTSSLLAARIEESLRLGRFLAKLLVEAQQLKTDTITFSTSAEKLLVSFKQAKVVQKDISIKSTWLNPIFGYLANRVCVLHGNPNTCSQLVDIENQTLDCDCSVIGPEFIFVVKAQTSRAVGAGLTLSLSNLRAYSKHPASEVLGIATDARPAFDKICGLDNGIILLSSPTTAHLKLSISAMLSLTGASYIGELSEIAKELSRSEISSQEAVIVSVRAEDPVDALLKVRELGLDIKKLQVRDSVCLGLLSRTCPYCSRKTVLDRTLLKTLPEGFILADWDGYVVGRGCEQCGQRGTRGFVAITSFLNVDADIANMVSANKDHESIVKTAHKNGTRSLLEDGIKKVFEGQLTLQNLFGLTSTISPAFLSLYRNEKSRSEAPTTLNDQPLFSKSISQSRPNPVLLVVEDDVDQRSILETVFKAQNYEVILAANGAEGLAMAEKHKPDLVITDLMMPIMDGTEFVTRLKSNAALRSIPILVLTVISDGDKEYSLLDLGAEDYCEKTVQRKILLKRVEGLLKRSKLFMN